MSGRHEEKNRGQAERKRESKDKQAGNRETEDRQEARESEDDSQEVNQRKAGRKIEIDIRQEVRETAGMH